MHHHRHDQKTTLEPPDPPRPSIFWGLIYVCIFGALFIINTHFYNWFGDDASTHFSPQCPIFYHQDHGLPSTCNPILSPTSDDTLAFLPSSVRPARPNANPTNALTNLRSAVQLVRTKYFRSDVGTWPDANDWTAAFAQTVLSAVMGTCARSGEYTGLEAHALFAETVASYYGQDALAIRYQAFDDMLWVALGWIEAINAITQSKSHFPALTANDDQTLTWYGATWIPAFAHRARIFWDLAVPGWDTERCDGGMVWNPRLVPYKNSITNELWVAASSAMWLYFPGDNNTSPFVGGTDKKDGSNETALVLSDIDPVPGKNRAHLEAALVGYDWIQDSGLMNAKGLYIDGFHITNWSTGGVSCDIPDHKVFTYNQGVILSGQVNLWRATGRVQYLIDGHRLIQSVISATGWDLASSKPVDDDDDDGDDLAAAIPPSHGLGRGGILEERCDAAGECSQDSQTFKGIFFHHMTAFCAPMPSVHEVRRDNGWCFDEGRYRSIRRLHASACGAYMPWVAHNVAAALATRDEEGNAGMWWGGSIWKGISSFQEEDGQYQQAQSENEDPNERGRGRTLETQIGLVALLRAYYELLVNDGEQRFWGKEW